MPSPPTFPRVALLSTACGGGAILVADAGCHAVRRIDISGGTGTSQAQVRSVLGGIAGLGQPRQLVIAADDQSAVFTTPTALVRAALPASDKLVRQ